MQLPKLNKKIEGAQGGFTLIELLVVIAVLGILAAVVLVAINPAKRLQAARDAGAKSDIGQMATALEAYYTENNGTYPTATSTLVPNQLKILPTQPTGSPNGGSNYTYAITPTGCLGTQASKCTDATLSYTLENPGISGYVYCYRTATGKAAEIASASCTP